MIDDVQNMDKPRVENIKNRMKMPMPWIFFLPAGFVCADKSRMNQNSKNMKTSLQDGDGVTAETFEALYAYIRIALPVVLVLENLRDLLSPTLETKDLSEAAYVMRKLILLGYGIVAYTVSKAEKVGSGCVRWRLYFVAIRPALAIAYNIDKIKAIRNDILEFCNAMYAEPESPSSCLVFSRLPMLIQRNGRARSKRTL